MNRIENIVTDAEVFQKSIACSMCQFVSVSVKVLICRVHCFQIEQQRNFRHAFVLLRLQEENNKLFLLDMILL